MSFTAFKYPLPKGQTYPIGLESLDILFLNKSLAVYFISSATWVRQVYPIDGITWPVIRMQNTKPMLRVRNEDMEISDDKIDGYTIIYSLPNNLKNEVSTLLKSFFCNRPKDITDDLLIIFSNNHIHIERNLPSWI